MLDNDTIAKIVSGASGAGIAAWLARATGASLFVMFAGGLAASYFVAPAVASAFNVTAHQPAVGFVVGFLAILMLRKVHDVIDGIPAGSVGGALVEWGRRMMGLPAQRSKEDDKP